MWLGMVALPFNSSTQEEERRISVSLKPARLKNEEGRRETGVEEEGEGRKGKLNKHNLQRMTSLPHLRLHCACLQDPAKQSSILQTAVFYFEDLCIRYRYTQYYMYLQK